MALMEYSRAHSFWASQYQVQRSQGLTFQDAYVQYAVNMLTPNDELRKTIHLSCYLPKKLRTKIFSALWYSLGNDHGTNGENIEKNWKKFGEDIEIISQNLDKLAAK